MSRPAGKPTDNEPLTKQQYLLLLVYLEGWARLLVELLWETGIRIGESLAIERKDLTTNGVWITREKRSDHLRELLPLSTSLLLRIRSFSYSHKEVRVFSIVQSTALRAIKKAGTKAGIRLDKNGQSTIHPHCIRHSMGYRIMATDFGDKTLDAKLTRGAAMMGHVQLESFLRYTNPPKENIKDGFGKVNE